MSEINKILTYLTVRQGADDNFINQQVFGRLLKEVGYEFN
jgi:hypothetical protein